MADDKIIRTINPDEGSLNDLFKELLDGLRDDLSEAQFNVEKYQKLISEDGGVEMYGTLCNSALTIKGSARDRQLKFLVQFKERVTRKETAADAKADKQKGSTSGNLSHEDVSKIIDTMKNQGDLDKMVVDFD